MRGLTLEALSTATGIGVSSLSEFENGKREPRLTQLEKIAAAHGKTIGWFFREEVPSADLVLWRERPADDEAVALESQFLRLCEQYHNLEEWTGEALECTLPFATGNADSFGYPQVERLAREFRSRFDLGDRPAFSLLSVLEDECGVRVFHLEFEPSGTAASLVGDRIGRATLLNAANVRWRRNFDLAHELFHLLTWNVFRVGDARAQAIASEREESLANAFASHLLLPTDALREAISEARRAGGALRHSDLFDVARQFDVSVEALLWRVARVFGRDPEITKHDIQVCGGLASAYETRSDTEVSTRPSRYRALVTRSLRDGKISIGRAAEYLGISRREAMKLDESEDVTDDEVSLSPA
jgi:Zn-dependent peptidase ImmA (M78 family)/transcriptional regulator with XRE-family HTH domain